jgi:hypothetical protein
VKDCDNGKMIIVSLDVDDLLIIGDDIDKIKKFKKSMLLVFEMTELGEMKHFFWERNCSSLMMKYSLTKVICQ